MPQIIQRPASYGYIYVPSIEQCVARKISLNGKSWETAQEKLSYKKSHMATPLKFSKFLRYLISHDSKLYKEITALKDPWGGEHLDACFEQRDDGLYVWTNNKTKAEKLDKDTLMENRLPGISLEGWLSDPTPQGLPRKDVKSGDLCYWAPMDGKVAGFVANSVRVFLDCNRQPLNFDLDLGVREIRNIEKLLREADSLYE